MTEQAGSQDKKSRSPAEAWALRGLYGATYVALGVAFVWYVFATQDRPRLDNAAFEFAALLILLAVFPWASSIKVFDALEIKRGMSQVRDEVSALRLHIAALSSATASSLAQTTVNVNAAAAEATQLASLLVKEMPEAERTAAQAAERYGKPSGRTWHDVVDVAARIDEAIAKLHELVTGIAAAALPRWMTVMIAEELYRRGVIGDNVLEAVREFQEIKNIAAHVPTVLDLMKEPDPFIFLGNLTLGLLEAEIERLSSAPAQSKTE